MEIDFEETGVTVKSSKVYIYGLGVFEAGKSVMGETFGGY